MKAGIKAFVYLMSIIGLVGLYVQTGWPWWWPLAAWGGAVTLLIFVLIALYIWVCWVDGPADRVPK